jgi:hypothetical protein
MVYDVSADVASDVAADVSADVAIALTWHMFYYMPPVWSQMCRE